MTSSLSRAACVVFSAGLVLIAAGSVSAKTPVGRVSAVNIETPHPYPRGDASLPVVWSHRVYHPGATFIKLHISRLDLGSGDRLRIADGRGRLVGEYTGRDTLRHQFWAPSALGDTAVIELRADAIGAGRGVAIDRYGHGTSPIIPETVCGTDQKQDVACYAGTPIETASRSVGLMLFEIHGTMFACTGFLISDQDHFMSNQHCTPTQAVVSSLEVRFNYQYTACGGGDVGATETFVGDRLLRADHEIDMAIMTLAGRPSARYGFLPLSGRDLAAGEALYLPQHPFGGVKKVSVIGCQVSTPKTDGYGPGTDFGHQCDTEPGSSGSPVLDVDNKVVGLHHIGNCTGSGGENLAVLMSRILSQSSLTVRGAKLIPRSGFVQLHADLTLALNSDGVSPLTEPVTLTLADADGPFYSAVVPAGALHQQGSNYVFTDSKGQRANGLRRLTVQVRSSDTVDVFATARGADLAGADRTDITVTIQIGDDVGSQTVQFRQLPSGLFLP